MATSVPVPMAQAEVGLGERGGVVDAVADHRDDAAFGLQAPDDVGLLGRQDLGDDLVDADLGRDRAGGRLVVAGQQHRPQPERLQRRDGLGGAVLDGVGDDEHGGRLSVPAGGDRGLPARLGGPARGVELGRAGASPSRPAAPGGRRRARGRRRRPRRRGPRGWRSRRPPAADPSAAAALAMACAMGCSEACSSAPTSRSAWSRSTPSATATSTRLILPVVTVPVLSSTTVSTVRVDSRTSGPLISSPSCAPRPVPTMQRGRRGEAERAGAGDDQHGDGGGEREASRSRRCRARTPSVASDSADDDRDEDAGDAVGEALDRRLAGLGVLDQAGDLGERGVGADLGRADDEAPAGVDGRARDLRARARPRPAPTRR